MGIVTSLSNPSFSASSPKEKPAIAAAPVEKIQAAPPVAFQASLQVLPYAQGVKLCLLPTQSLLKKGQFPRVAVFTQRPYVWVIVTESIAQDFEAFKEFPPGYMSPEVIPNTNGFVMRLQIPFSATPSIDYNETGEWSLSLGAQKPKHPFGSLPFLTRKLFAFLQTPSYLAINLKDIVPVHLKDPEKQTDLIVIPTADPGVGFPGAFHYADFNLLQTFQGLVLSPTSSDLTVTAGEFVKISREGGLLLSSLEDRQNIRKTKKTRGFFIFDVEKLPDLDQTHALKKFEDQTLHAVPEERFRAQLTLAQFLISQGKGEEAEKILELITKRNSRLQEDGEVKTLLGVSSFLNQDTLQALQTFSTPNLPPEAELWQGATLIKLGLPLQGVPLMKDRTEMLKNHSPFLRVELAMIAADGCIQNNDKDCAEKFLSLAKKGPLSSAQSSSLASLQEDLLILKMDPALQESYSVQIKKKGGKENPRAVAEKDFADIQSRLQDNKITQEQAIQLLEDLRTSWRGDDLENRLLQKLGQLYGLQKAYFKAMASYGRLLRFFPNSPEKKTVEAEMSLLFQQALASAWAPFQKIAFFNEYRAFEPSEDKKTKLAIRLGQELIDLDLPDQSANILEKELENNPHPLLLIYLAKAYIQDKKAHKALQILDNPLLNGGELSQKNYLRGLSYFQLKNFEKALACLEKNETSEGKKLKMNIFWAQKNWKKLSGELQKRIRQQESPDSETLLQLAIAFYQAGDTENLQILRDKNQDLMVESPQKRFFLLLTQPLYKGKISSTKIKKTISENDDFRDLPRLLDQGQISR